MNLNSAIEVIKLLLLLLEDSERLRNIKSHGNCSSRHPERVRFLRFFINPNLFILFFNILDFLLIAVNYK